MHTSLHVPLTYLRQYVTGRLALHFEQATEVNVDADAWLEDDSPFSRWIMEQQPEVEEYVALLLAFAPHIQPGFFDDILKEFLPDGGNFIEFGGTKGMNHRGLLPTGDTLLFILAGTDVNKRAALQLSLLRNSKFFQQGILQLDAVPAGEPPMSGRLLLDEETADIWITGEAGRPKFTSDFAAEYITTMQEWDDLILNPHTLEQIREIEEWVRHQHQLLHDWNMIRRVKQGYCALFHGPPGTGKTMAAMLLGKYTGLDVYKIDLSKVVSKYIGETEKNLSRIFDKAQRKQWILFFDEADTLFGKRTEINDARDRYANQEVGYLLQRIEQYGGLVILASNFKSNMDEAFLRRIQNIIYFPIPAAEERFTLWKQAFPEQVKFSKSISFEHISNYHELTGANINNIAYHCCLKLIAGNQEELSYPDLQLAIKRELQKEGRG
ncbi:ATP-binding protein [Chitinophaga sp. Cy-1792]|uniref:ATP-binding protein n=1 Tax=Chitinophaga sp. Cy-1792 TaxID=2608339 RepID=UPI001421FA91|nr:ATP-binding protein [Chitinophaga sp. Cy-1792]NIG53817.1 ATP-binding protein [Chitinophaga sp. Cy-1792]